MTYAGGVPSDCWGQVRPFFVICSGPRFACLEAAERSTAAIMNMFANLKKHLTDEARLQTLRDIESQLTERPFPPQLVIENTSYCNLKCIHCSHREMLRPQRHMDRWLWDKIVEEVGSESPE